jgi:hypothetical protein
MYFNRSNRLKLTPDYGTETITLRNQVSSGLTMEQAINYEFTGAAFNSMFVKNTLYLDSDPLTTDMEWTGTPKINLDYNATGNNFCQFNFQIYERRPDGTQDFVDRINYTDRNYTANSRRTANFKGQAHSHIFKAGDRIRLVITNLDTAPSDAPFLQTNPFVLPVLVNSDNNIFLNGSSYIELPVHSNNINQQNPFVISEQNKSLTGTPDEFSLNQNYPNPFNPSTTIQYNIAAGNLVQLKVYDLTGKEVKTLVNEFQMPGSYSVDFNANNLASGIYYYNIVSGNFNEVKKMILIK